MIMQERGETELGELLHHRGDIDGARTPFQTAADRADAKTAARAQRALRKLDRTPLWSRLRKPSR
ncbi:hypothetical protein ABH926_009057 [Catenulispora sp. GP43]|uniref:hypothetical protein n=1 Tax=Catenulispora sp. GP43 TaxID=3156263 RepID=UPI0035199389